MIEKGKKVRVVFKATLNDGYVFDEATSDDPLDFIVGDDEILDKFEDAVCRLNPGEEIKTVINAIDAYGLYDSTKVKKVDRGGFPHDLTPKVGQELELEHEEGIKEIVIVKEVQEDFVLLDSNHPLAGEDLHFDIKLLSVE